MEIEYPLTIGPLTIEGDGTVVIGDWMADPLGHVSVPRYFGPTAEREVPLAQRTTWRCASNHTLVANAAQSVRARTVIVHMGRDMFAQLCTDVVHAHRLTPTSVQEVDDGSLVVKVDVKMAEDTFHAIPPFSEIHVHPGDEWLGRIAAEAMPRQGTLPASSFA